MDRCAQFHDLWAGCSPDGSNDKRQDESEFLFDHNWGYTSEDCMRVNVWTPGISDGKKRPVLFGYMAVALRPGRRRNCLRMMEEPG